MKQNQLKTLAIKIAEKEYSNINIASDLVLRGIEEGLALAQTLVEQERYESPENDFMRGNNFAINNIILSIKQEKP